MLAFSAWRHNLITLTSAHPLPVLVPLSTGCSGMQDNPKKVKTGKKTIIHSIACLDNIVMEVLSQQLIWIPKANRVRTSDCIINTEREAKHFRKLPQNKTSDLISSPSFTYRMNHLLSTYPFRYLGIISEMSYASSDWWAAFKEKDASLDCFSQALEQLYLNSRQAELSDSSHTLAVSPGLT